MKIANKHFYGTTEVVDRLFDEAVWIARHHVERIDSGHMVVYALPKQKPKKNKDTRPKPANYKNTNHPPLDKPE